ncbi:hypothetical protein [Nocardia sp. CA-120079]|uniref:hypothetical protein n=1 Tax=Nocardia sp. CA-120079 TaxID=3239974 RepID=UPI003D954BB2
MNLPDEEVPWAELAVTGWMRARRTIEGIPEPMRRLALRLRCAIADQSEGAEPDAVGGDEIDTRQAAAILGCTERHVRRLAADLDGDQVGRTWVFRRDIVQAYADARGSRIVA